MTQDSEQQPDPAVGRSRSRVLAVLGGILLALVAGVFATRGVDADRLAAAFGNVDLTWVGLAAVCSTFAIVAHGWAWRIGLAEGGAGDVETRHAVAATWIGKAANQVLPGKLGEVARVMLIRHHLPAESREVSRIVGSLVAQRALNIGATLLIITGASLTVAPPAGIPGGRTAPLLVVAALALIVIAIVRLGPKLERSTRPGRVARTLRSLVAGAGVLVPSRASLAAFGLHVIAVTSQLVMYECLLRGFDVATPMTAPLLIITLIGLAGAVPGAPGGIGLNQAALVAPLGVAYGVDPTAALAFALGMQAVVALVAVVGGAVALLFHSRTRRLVTAIA